MLPLAPHEKYPYAHITYLPLDRIFSLSVKFFIPQLQEFKKLPTYFFRVLTLCAHKTVTNVIRYSYESDLSRFATVERYQSKFNRINHCEMCEKNTHI